MLIDDPFYFIHIPLFQGVRAQGLPQLRFKKSVDGVLVIIISQVCMSSFDQCTLPHFILPENGRQTSFGRSVQ